MKGDKKMTHMRGDAGRRISSSRSNNARAKSAQSQSTLRKQHRVNQPDSQSERVIPSPTASTSALQHVSPTTSSAPQNKRSSDKNRCSPLYYGSENSSLASAAHPKKPRRAGDVVESFQLTNVTVVETLHSAAEQILDDKNIPSVIGNVSPHDPRVRALAYQRAATLEQDIIDQYTRYTKPKTVKTD